VLDLDDPRVLVEEGLRPSHVATGERARTQVDAATLSGSSRCVRSRFFDAVARDAADFLGLRPR